MVPPWMTRQAMPARHSGAIPMISPVDWKVEFAKKTYSPGETEYPIAVRRLESSARAAFTFTIGCGRHLRISSTL